MKLEHSFTVPVPPEQAWGVLLDIRTVAPCMPGAAIDSVDGDDFTGTVKVKVGPITVTYRGSASFTEKNEAARRAVLVAKAKETKGSGTARATVTGTLSAAPEGTRVDVVTDLTITGKPAQFGRGVMADVGGRLIGQFADCLAEELGRSAAGPATVPAAAPAAVTEPVAGAEVDPAVDPAMDPLVAPVTTAAVVPSPPMPAPAPQPVAASRRSPEAIDLLGTAGMPVAKRLAPLAGVLLALAVLLRTLRRRRR